MIIELTKGVELDDKRFEYLYSGFIIGGALKQSKGLPVLRRELAILDKLHAISKEVEGGRRVFQEEIARELTGGSLDFTKQEFEMITDYIGSVPWSTGKSGREAVALIDWLASL